MLAGKKIVLGVTGGIAVYKVVDLVSRLRKQQAEVKVVMTQAATKFVSPLTFQEMSANPVVVSMWDEIHEYSIEHIALAAWADLFVIAPATANIIGKMASGIADDMLSTTVMATVAPVLLCPAMNSNMYLNVVTQENIALLRTRGFEVMEPGCGVMACGTTGPGRLPEPTEIMQRINEHFARSCDLCGKKVLVTAGGTREAIDPVRYIGNRSSGKMGYAVATAALARGAKVTLVSTVTLPSPGGAEVINVESAEEMRQAVLARFEEADIVIKAAAVADFRPAVMAERKIKKGSDEVLTLVLQRNPDILQELGQRKSGQFLVGFAAETHDLEAYAKEKIAKKNLDMIVANDVTAAGAGFGTETNIVKFLYPDGSLTELKCMPKRAVADKLLDEVVKRAIRQKNILE